MFKISRFGNFTATTRTLKYCCHYSRVLSKRRTRNCRTQKPMKIAVMIMIN